MGQKRKKGKGEGGRAGVLVQSVPAEVGGEGKGQRDERVCEGGSLGGLSTATNVAPLPPKPTCTD